MIDNNNHPKTEGIMSRVLDSISDNIWLTENGTMHYDSRWDSQVREVISEALNEADAHVVAAQMEQRNMRDELMQLRGKAEHLIRERSERIARETEILVTAIREFGELMKGN